jgi:hypothetical protein
MTGAEQEINNMALIYEELQRKGKLDKEGVAYALGLTITDWNLRKCTALMKRIVEEYPDVKLKKVDKGKYILLLEGWEELKRQREKKLFNGDRYIQDLLSIVYDGNKIEITEFKELITLYQLKYIAEVINTRNTLTGGARWYIFRLGDALHVFKLNNKEGRYLIYDKSIESKKLLNDLYNIYQKHAKEIYIIKLDYDRQLKKEKEINLKIIEKLKETEEGIKCLIACNQQMRE